MKKSAQVQKSGFTLVELLVVIAIIAILAAVVVLIINPLELTKRGRDAARLGDLANLQNAINLTLQEATGSSTVAILCKSSGTYPCGGSAGQGQSYVGSRDADGTGWVKVDLSSSKNVQVPVLPVDPINDATNHYTYCANNDAWELDAKLESDQQKGKNISDGGDDPVVYEIGSNLKLISPTGGSCAY